MNLGKSLSPACNRGNAEVVKLAKIYSLRMFKLLLKHSEFRTIDINALDENGRSIKDEAAGKDSKYLKALEDFEKKQGLKGLQSQPLTAKDRIGTKIKTEPGLAIEVDKNLTMTFEDIKPIVKLERIDNLDSNVLSRKRKRNKSITSTITHDKIFYRRNNNMWIVEAFFTCFIRIPY